MIVMMTDESDYTHVNCLNNSAKITLETLQTSNFFRFYDQVIKIVREAL